jgi:hypothetical protein
MKWIAGQVLGLQSVHGWEPDNRTPREVEPEVIVANINSPQVPVFINEEVQNVDRMEYVGDEH